MKEGETFQALVLFVRAVRSVAFLKSKKEISKGDNNGVQSYSSKDRLR